MIKMCKGDDRDVVAVTYTQTPHANVLTHTSCHNNFGCLGFFININIDQEYEARDVFSLVHNVAPEQSSTVSVSVEVISNYSGFSSLHQVITR